MTESPRYTARFSIAGVGLLAATSILVKPRPVVAQAQEAAAVFDSMGRLKLPNPATFCTWVFVGAPLTPNALNNRRANFP